MTRLSTPSLPFHCSTDDSQREVVPLPVTNSSRWVTFFPFSLQQRLLFGTRCEGRLLCFEGPERQHCRTSLQEDEGGGQRPRGGLMALLKAEEDVWRTAGRQVCRGVADAE